MLEIITCSGVDPPCSDPSTTSCSEPLVIPDPAKDSLTDLMDLRILYGYILLTLKKVFKLLKTFYQALYDHQNEYILMVLLFYPLSKL